MKFDSIVLQGKVSEVKVSSFCFVHLVARNVYRKCKEYVFVYLYHNTFDITFNTNGI